MNPTKELLILLHRFAEVDGEVTEHEANLVNEFADKMNLDFQIKPGAVDEKRTDRLLNTREALHQYLSKSPPNTQVEQLEHLLHKLISADGNDHKDELSSFEELRSAIREYLSDESTNLPFRVMLAPQSEEQVLRINGLLSRAHLHTGCGGKGVTVGEFHTRDFADTVCQEYRDLGFFCVVTDEMVSAT